MEENGKKPAEAETPKKRKRGRPKGFKNNKIESVKHFEKVKDNLGRTELNNGFKKIRELMDTERENIAQERKNLATAMN